MRAPSARCEPNSVTTRKWTGWAKDAAHAKSPTYGAWSAAIACSVQPASSSDVAPHLREDGVTYLAALFHADPLLAIRDQVLWGTRTLTVTGVIDAAGRGRTFRVLCTETV